jgi:hypothetical protein
MLAIERGSLVCQCMGVTIVQAPPPPPLSPSVSLVPWDPVIKTCTVLYRTVTHYTACRQALGKYAGFQLGQRKQLQEVYDELGKPTEKRSAGGGRLTKQYCSE